jgi:DNA-binding NtrC family response regulator
MAGELTALRRRLTVALEQVERGRHEPGCRALRQVIGGLARRREWEEATRGGMALARALLRRGRARDAAQALDEVQERLIHVERGTPIWAEAGILAGIAAVDGGRLDAAERLLHTALALAEADPSGKLVARARLALARCLFWRGRYDEARRALEFESTRSGEDPHSQAIVIHVAALSSRVAVGRSDAAAAVSTAVSALEAARRTGHAALIAKAACASAFAHSAVGDRTAMDRDIEVSVAASRASRDTLCAMRARLVGAEYAARHGQPGQALALVRRLSKLPAEHLPSTVRARRDLVADLVRSSAPRQDVIARHVGATALPGLALFASGLLTDSPQADHMAVTDALEILRCCQIADDARAVLAEALSRLRAQLGASAIACFSPDGVVLASEGGRVEPRIAARVLAARQAITPHLLDGIVEGGAPVRYGGDAIAALVGRWAAGGLHDASRASMAMALAATAIGPAVAEVIASRRPRSLPGIGDLVGISPAIEEVRRAVERAAPAPFPVLVEGESGSGKELVARALHRLGPRRDRPFCSLNCAALPDELVESELFGHARGAFTGAASERPGVFEEAHTGTLFLDEVGELSPRAQAKVLRTIQEGELRRVGENINRRVDVRIVAATNRDLRSEVAGGRFRRDLLYRLDVVRITVPPLRERREDIAPLVERVWLEATARVGSRATLASGTVCALADYDWPGNVRELQNVLAALAVRSPKRGVLPPAALPPSFRTSLSLENSRLDEARRSFEERFVRAALVRTGGHRMQAAEQLGVTRQGLAKLMTRLGIND